MTTPTDISADLKPCPFCGGQPDMSTPHAELGYSRTYICCENPDCRINPSIDRKTQQAVIEAWNQRAVDAETAALRAENERLREIESLALKVRNAQRHYFKTRTQEALIASKTAEKALDAALTPPAEEAKG